jgi:N-6 DNA Methylase
MTRRDNEFQTISSEGGLLPPDLFRRVLDPNAKLEGTAPSDYGLPPGERLNEGITQSWNRLRKHWAEFRGTAKNLPEGEPGTGLTNDKWSVPLLRELGFGLLPASAAPTIDGKVYAINRFFGATAIHLVGCGLSLDRRTAGARGAAVGNPHGLLQDFLNRSPANLWGILSNGLSLRILRDTQAISRQSYLEFDLEAMFDGEVFSDFVLLWLMAHATRFAAREGDIPESCWLERWTKIAEVQGTRALGELRGGVEKALQTLGQGFVGHPKNTGLRDALRSGQLTASDLHGQLLRVVYRLIFLFVAEDRTLDGIPLLHPPDTSDASRLARERYATHYSAGRLRELAAEIRGSRHGDLWRQFNLVVGALSVDERFQRARGQLALPILGSFLWSSDSTAALNAPTLAVSGGTELANTDFLEAIQNLAFTRQQRNLRPVDYKNLGAEELGGVYESLLSLTPQVSGDGATFTFAEFAGNERKTSGAYYTPDSLVQCLLDSALNPVLEEAIRGKTGEDAEQAILHLKICDPAAGSGHFLVGAAHRIALRLARIRAGAQGEGEPSPVFYQHALRDVIGRCLYGVDINPMAAELCRVSLWLEALDPGKPLSFLDHHIRVGNSLLGTTPALIAGGLADDAFIAIEGDDKKVCAQLKKRNKAEREGFEQRELLRDMEEDVGTEFAAIAKEAGTLDNTPDDTVDAIQRKAGHFSRLVGSTEYKHAQRVADTWCAVFVWPKTVANLAQVVTTAAIKQLTTDANAISAGQIAEVVRLANRYQFFHWHLSFPEVFAKGGFDCVLGNPPWEKINLKKEEYFAITHPEIADASSKAQRARLIDDLVHTDPAAHSRYLIECEKHAHFSSFFRFSGRFPLTGVSRINLYSVFCEAGLRTLSATGRLGMVLASGVVTDDNNKDLFSSLVRDGRLVHAWDFENSKAIFASVHRSFKFLLLCALGAPAKVASDFAFYLADISELEREDRHFHLEIEDFDLLNPLTGTCPAFRSRQDAIITKRIYRNAPPWSKHEKQENWPGIPKTPFNIANDSKLFVGLDKQSGNSRVQLLPLFEAKLVHQFNHRFSTFVGQGDDATQEFDAKMLLDPRLKNQCRYLLESRVMSERFPGRWFLVWRDITGALNERTSVSTIIPGYPCAHTLSLVLELGGLEAMAMVASLDSFLYDYCARQKVTGTHLNHGIWKQLPIPQLSQLVDPCLWAGNQSLISQWLPLRVLELIYTAWDLEPFANDCGFDGPPFSWDDSRRFLLRCELDAAFFHLYLLSDANGNWQRINSESESELMRLKESFSKPREAVDHILDTFPIVKKKDIAMYGDYRTKLQILEIYDEMQNAIKSGIGYKTKLDPPPGDKRRCHAPRTTESA